MTLPLERFRMLVGGSLSSGIPRSCKLCNQIISGDEAFGNEREIVREPGVDSAFERANPGDSLGSKQQRHTGAGRFVGSRAVENDVAIPGNLAVALFDLFHRYTKRARDHLRKCLDIHGLAQVND